MAFFKVSYIFKSPVSGWAEIFYQQSNTLDDFTGVSADERQRIINPRAAGVVMQAKKITEEGGLRRSKIFRVNLPALATANSQGADPAGVTAKVRLNFSGGGGRVLNVRGMKDNATVPSASTEPEISSEGLAFLNDYIARLKSVSGTYLGKRLVSIAVNPWQDVVSLQVDETNANWTRVNITTSATPPQPGDLVYFQGIDKLQVPWIKGIYRVVGTTSATRFSIPTIYREPIAVTTLRNVRWRLAEYEYPAIVSGNFMRWGTRDTRSPFDRVRGARPALRTRL